MRADLLERKAQATVDPLDEATYEVPRPDPARALPDPARIAALRECLDRCPDRYRVVIELGESGYDVAELAGVLEVAPETVYQIRHRARQWLQRCINEALK
jgi:RNA polymerase sigma factor (sigma-70 family)